jgi:hypothetical protein
MNPGRSNVRRVAFALGMLAAVAWVDYASGYEISVFVLYAGCVAWATWYLGFAWGVVFTLVSTAAWFGANLAAGWTYSNPWVVVDRMANQFVLLGFTAFSVDRFRRAIERHKGKVKQLEGILPICASCKRIRDESGHWNDMAAYLREHTEADPQTKLCPDCAREHYVSNYPQVR